MENCGDDVSIFITLLPMQPITGETVQQVAVYKYLGIWLDDVFSFLHYIIVLLSKVKSRFKKVFTILPLIEIQFIHTFVGELYSNRTQIITQQFVWL